MRPNKEENAYAQPIVFVMDIQYFSSFLEDLQYCTWKKFSKGSLDGLKQLLIIVRQRIMEKYW